MATKKNDDTAPEETPTVDPATPAPEPEKVVTVEDQGIGAQDPYPTGAPAKPEEAK